VVVCGDVRAAWPWFFGWLAAGAVAFAVAHLRAGVWTIDDAEITFSYARSLVAGHGFSVSPEGPRVEGFSNPLMLLVCTVAEALSLLDPFAFHTLLEPLEFGLLLFAAWSLLGSVLPARDPRRAILVAAFAGFELLTPATAIWYGSGLENLQTTLTIAFMVMRLSQVLAGRPRLAADTVSLVLVALVRPEGPLYVAVACAAALLYGLIASPALWRWRFVGTFATMCLVAGGVMLVGLALRWWMFASLLPNTYYAKTGSGAPAMKSDGYLRELMTYSGAVWFGLAGLLMPVRPEARRAKLLLAALLPTALVLPAVGGRDWMGEHRFGTTYVAVAHLLFVLALSAARLPVGLWRLPHLVRRIRLAVTAAAVLLPLASLFGNRQVIPDFYSKQRATVADVLDIQGLTRIDIQRHLGLFEPVAAIGDAGGSRLAGKMQLLDTLALTDFHIPHIRNDPKLLYRYQFGERSVDMAIWHGAGALARQAFGDDVVLAVEFDGSPRAFWIKRSLLVLDRLPEGARPLGQRGAVQVWASPATLWHASPGAYARVELIFQLAADSVPAEHPGDARVVVRLEDTREPDEEDLALLGVTGQGNATLKMAPGVFYRQGFLVRAPERAGDYPVVLARGLPGPPLPIGSVRVAPPESVGPRQLDEIVGTDAVLLVDRAQRLAQLAEQMQPRRRRGEIADDLYSFRAAKFEHRRAMLDPLARLWSDFVAKPPMQPALRARRDDLADGAAAEVARTLGAAKDASVPAAPLADRVLAAGRLVDEFRRRRIIGVLDRQVPAAGRPRALLPNIYARLHPDLDAVVRYKLLAGLVMLEPRDMFTQRALLLARRAGIDLPYR